MLRVGETVGPYEILARLKAGGMATLFVGKKRGAAGFSRHVAIKVVHEHLASDEEFVRMFVDEALLQARIHHPNVVHVEELGETVTDGAPTHYLVMEYVYGCSLAQFMDALARRDRRLSPEMAVHIAIQTLAGLHAAHELKDEKGTNLGVVHRDVSPQNVLLAYEGHVKLIDFGVAKARNRSQQTTGASLKGKIRYMPPEQAIGVSTIDRRADVYALGIVLWEMLAFRKLFNSKDDLVLLDMVRNPRIVPPGQIAKEVPPEIDRVVMKALAPRPEDRWATAQDFRRALAEAMPKAMLVDAPHVGDLLLGVMSEQMQKDREALPSQLSAVVANDARRAEIAQQGEAVEQMTISGAGRAYLSDMAIDVELPSEISRPSGAAPIPIPALSLPPTPSNPDAWRPEPALGTPARPLEPASSRMPLLLGIAASVLVILAAGAWLMLRETTQPIATQLATEPTTLPPPSQAGVIPVPTEVTSIEVTPPPTSEVVPVTTMEIAPATTRTAAAPPPTTRTAAAPPPPTTRVAAPPSTRTASAPPTTRAPRRHPPASSTTGTDAVPLADEW